MSAAGPDGAEPSIADAGAEELPRMVIGPEAAGGRAESVWLSAVLDRVVRSALRVNATVLGSVSDWSADLARRLEATEADAAPARPSEDRPGDEV